MSDIIKQENKLSVRNNHLITYNDIMSHTFWMETPARTVLSNKYYFVNQTALEKSDENKHRLFVTDIYTKLTNEHLFTMENTLSSLKMVKSAENRKDLLILYNYSYNNNTIMVFNNVGGKLRMKELPLKAKDRYINMLDHFRDPEQYKNQIYFLDRIGELFKISLDDGLIETCGISNLKSFTLDTRYSRIICCNTDDRLITTIDLETQKKKTYENISGSRYSASPVPADAPEKLFIVTYGALYYYNIKQSKLITSLLLDNIKHKIPSFNKKTLKKDRDGRIHYVQSSKDDRYYAVIFSTTYNYIFAVYDSKSENIVLDLNMKMENGLPEYIKASMVRYNFSACAIERLSEVFEPCSLEANERRADSSLYQNSRIEGNVLECRFASKYVNEVYHDSIYRLDLDHISLKRIDLETEFPDMKRHNLQRIDNCILCEPKEQNDSNMKFILYDSENKKELDSKTIDCSGTGISLETCRSRHFPCLKKNSTYYIKRDLSMIIAANRNKKLDLISNANTILDITEDYILRKSENGYKLFIYSRNGGPTKYIALMSQLYSASFSNKEGFLNVFYLGGRDMERYDFNNLSLGMAEPEITVPLRKSPYTFRMDEFRESPDGRYIYNIYLPEKTTDYKRFMYIYDTQDQKCIYDNVMDYDEEHVYRIDTIDEKGRFITLLPDDWVNKLIFVNPFTMELLAKAYFFVEGKFLIKIFTNGQESNYFCTNADEMVKVFLKKRDGTPVLLESGDIRRKEYISLYNDRQKTCDRILNPDKFAMDEKAMEKLLEYSNNNLLLESRTLLE